MDYRHERQALAYLNNLLDHARVELSTKDCFRQNLNKQYVQIPLSMSDGYDSYSKEELSVFKRNVYKVLNNNAKAIEECNNYHRILIHNYYLTLRIEEIKCTDANAKTIYNITLIADMDKTEAVFNVNLESITLEPEAFYQKTEELESPVQKTKSPELQLQKCPKKQRASTPVMTL